MIQRVTVEAFCSDLRPLRGGRVVRGGLLDGLTLTEVETSFPEGKARLVFEPCFEAEQPTPDSVDPTGLKGELVERLLKL